MALSLKDSEDGKHLEVADVSIGDVTASQLSSQVSFFEIRFDIYAFLLHFIYYFWQYFYILHIYAVNTTTTSPKSAGITEVNSVPSPSCTVQGTFRLHLVT